MTAPVDSTRRRSPHQPSGLGRPGLGRPGPGGPDLVGPALVGAAAILAGAGIPGLVVLVLGRSQALSAASDDARGHAWRIATIAFAFGQSLGAYGLTFLFDRSQRHDILFAAGTLAMVATLLAGDIGARARRSPGVGARGRLDAAAQS